MNSRKSKDRPKLYDDHKNYPSSNKAHTYDITENGINVRKDRKSLKAHNINTESQSKENEAIFKNMEKCNQKMEYYKLMGSLQQQKRAMLEQQNNLLKQENLNLKAQAQSDQKQIRQLIKKLQKYGNQLAKYQEMSSNQENFIIELPNKQNRHGSKSKIKKPSPKNYQENQEENCQKCQYLEEQLIEQRALYQKDRTYLKEQIQNLTENLSDNQKQQKLLKKELSGISAFHDKKLTDLSEKFRAVENQLKKQLTQCYREIQEKCDLIRELEQKIDFFEQQNYRVIKLLNIFDGNVSQTQNTVTKKVAPYQIQRQGRSKSSYNVKEKHPKYPIFFNSNENMQSFLEEDKQSQKGNGKKARKCGSIKKIQNH